MIFIGREHEIYPDKIITRMINGSESTIQLSSFVNAVEIKNVYLLYVNKSNSIFFPKRAFRQPEDELWFHNNVFLKIKSNRL